MDVVIGRRQRRDQVLGRRAMSSFQKKSGRRREPPTLRDERARERTTGSGIAARTGCLLGYATYTRQLPSANVSHCWKVLFQNAKMSAEQRKVPRRGTFTHPGSRMYFIRLCRTWHTPTFPPPDSHIYHITPLFGIFPPVISAVVWIQSQRRQPPSWNIVEHWVGGG